MACLHQEQRYYCCDMWTSNVAGDAISICAALDMTILLYHTRTCCTCSVFWQCCNGSDIFWLQVDLPELQKHNAAWSCLQMAPSAGLSRAQALKLLQEDLSRYLLISITVSGQAFMVLVRALPPYIPADNI